MINNIGLYWSIEDVQWGAGKRKGELWGRKKMRDEPVKFRDQIAIYVLYNGREPIYFGQTGGGNHQRLFARLKQHQHDDLADRWDHFSWFGFRWVKKNGDLANTKSNVQGTLKKALDHI